jgi:hypothetical protein
MRQGFLLAVRHSMELDVQEFPSHWLSDQPSLWLTKALKASIARQWQ